MHSGCEMDAAHSICGDFIYGQSKMDAPRPVACTQSANDEENSIACEQPDYQDAAILGWFHEHRIYIGQRRASESFGSTGLTLTIPIWVFWSSTLQRRIG